MFSVNNSPLSSTRLTLLGCDKGSASKLAAAVWEKQVWKLSHNSQEPHTLDIFANMALPITQAQQGAGN